MVLGKIGVREVINFSKIPTSFIKIPDLPSSFFIMKNPVLRCYVSLKSCTENDPEFFLTPEEIPVNDDLDPVGGRKDLAYYEYMRNTPGFSHTRFLLVLQAEEPYFYKKQYGKFPQKKLELMNGPQKEDYFSDSDSEDEHPPVLDPEDPSALLLEVEEKDEIMKNLRSRVDDFWSLETESHTKFEVEMKLNCP